MGPVAAAGPAQPNIDHDPSSLSAGMHAPDSNNGIMSDPETQLEHPVHPAAASDTNIIHRVPWGTLSLISGTAILISVCTNLVWLSTDEDAKTVPELALRISQLSSSFMNAPWVLAIMSLLTETHTGRRRALWGVLVWFVSVVLLAVLVQIGLDEEVLYP
jgi:hypothetical protein